MNDDYISDLNVRPGASHAECRAAYIALAKQWHPDRNNSPEAVAQFNRVAVAYARSLKSNGSRESRPSGNRMFVAGVVHCSRCSADIVFPRRAEFVGVLSLAFWSWRWKLSGIFCPNCARSAAFKTSVASLCLGWWSLPGVVLTPLSIVSNLMGGRQDKSVNFRLSCHNLIALSAAGDSDGARSLARVIKAQGQSLPVTVAHLVSSLTAEPAHTETEPSS